jgi:hypothetical protein
MSRPTVQSKHVLQAVCLAFLMAFASHGHAETVAQHETFIVGFSEAPLATYNGELGSIPAPPRKGEGRGRVDVSSPAAKAYVNHLRGRQADKVKGMGKALGRQVEPSHSMQHAFNGVIVQLTLEEADALREQPGVVLIEPYHEYELGTDTGPNHIGAPAVWSNGTGLPPGLTAGSSIPGGRGAKSSVRGNAPAQRGARGEGVVFGIVDSGVNFGSPSFAEVDLDGYRHKNPLGEGNYLGTCAPGGIDEGRCNAKLIGGYDYICTLTTICQDPTLREFPGFSDENGHGSHVASTAAGNRRLATFRGNDVEIAGVAPRGNIIAYDACYTNAAGQGLCPNVSTLAAINQAVADGVDVINFSIGGGQFPWSQANSLAFLAASDAGVFVSASAGNGGPGAATLSNVQPWVSSVAAAQHGRGGFNQVLVVTGPGTPPAALQEVVLAPGVSGVAQTADIPGTTPLFVSPGIDTAADGCAAFPADQFAGGIAVIRRGTCSFSIKTNNAAASGAIAVVIANNQPGTLSPSVPGTTIPAYLASQADGNALRDFAAANPGATAAIPVAARQFPNTADALAAFSSRGPSGFDYIKPDITGPGVDILAAFAGAAPTGFEEIVNTISGTSMSSPHNAGAAGLLRQLHPDWTPAEIKSAMMMTAAQTVLLQDQATPADPFAGGAGRMQVDAAAKAGLVLGESTENYLAADPAIGGDPSALNLASMAQSRCIGACTFERTFRATRANQRNWDARIEGLRGSVDQPRFNLGSNGMGTLRVTIDTSAFASDGSWHFGTLVLTPRGKSDSPVLRLPIAVSVPPPEVQLSATEVSVTLPAGASGEASVDVSNNGGPTLDYFIQASGLASRGILDQPRGAVGNGSRSGFITSLGFGLYAADDFTLADATLLSSVRTEGFTQGSPVGAGASAITWSIFPDAGGTPAGNPETSPGAAIWSYTAAPNSPGVTTDAASTITLNLAAAGQALELPPGTYWVVVHSTTATVANNWIWFYSNSGSGNAPRTVFPASTGPNWGPGAAFAGLAVQMNGGVSCASPSWVTSVTPSSGSLRFGDSDTLSIRVNTAGLAPGVYSAFVCVASNDPVTPQATVRVVLNVQ